MAKRKLALGQVYRHLEPGPVVLITTAYKRHANVMTLSWLTMMDFEPPIVGFVLSNRNYSFNALKVTKECVINIPTVAIVDKVVKCGNSSGRKINKFKTFELTPTAASSVQAPLIEECYANFECKVIDMRLAKNYNFFILEVVQAWIDPAQKQPRTIHHRGKGEFMVAGKFIKLPSKMK